MGSNNNIFIVLCCRPAPGAPDGRDGDGGGDVWGRGAQQAGGAAGAVQPAAALQLRQHVGGVQHVHAPRQHRPRTRRRQERGQRAAQRGQPPDGLRPPLLSWELKLCHCISIRVKHSGVKLDREQCIVQLLCVTLRLII